MSAIGEQTVLNALNKANPEADINQLSEAEAFVDCPNIGTSGRLAVVRYDAARKILMDQEHFSSQGVARNMLEDLAPDIRLKMSIVEDWLLYSDTARKKEIKSCLMKSMNPEFMRQFHTNITEFVQKTVAALPTKGEIDVISDLASPIPLIAMCEFMQIPHSDKDMLKQITADLLLLAEPTLTDDIQLKLSRGWSQSFDYFRDIVVEKKKKSDVGLVSTLTNIRINDKPLEDDEVVNQSISLLLGAHETTINLICNTIKHVVHGRGEDQSGIDAKLYVDEVLRFDPPSKLTARVAIKDSRVNDQDIAEGQRILVLFGSTNRDATRFEQPFDFNARRAPNPYLSFGVGNHFCLGANIAKAQSVLFLTEFLNYLKVRDLEIKNLAYKDSVVFRSMSRFTVG